MSTLGRASVMEQKKDTLEVSRLKARLRTLLIERENHQKLINELKLVLSKYEGRAGLNKRGKSKKRSKSSKKKRSSKRRKSRK
tara:strand:- start:940 stop:1188 length:249 start_codon:yes stop_codon:yes gene_type:complete